jgi:hypothetical protein
MPRKETMMFAFCRMGKVALLLVPGVLALPSDARAAGAPPAPIALAKATNLLKSVVGTGLPQAAGQSQTALNLVLGFPFLITAVPPPPGEVPPDNVQLVQQAQTLLIQAQGQLNGSSAANASQANELITLALRNVEKFLGESPPGHHRHRRRLR